MGGRIIYKKPREIATMREAGAIVSRTLEALRQAAQPGVSTGELNDLAYEMITEAGAKPSFLNYRGFPGTICVSINEEVVHGIGQADRRLTNGDLLKIDLGVRLRGLHGDSALTVAVGEVSEENRRLMAVTHRSLWLGLAAARVGGRLMDIGRAVQEYVEANGYAVVRELVGHGVGRRLHEEPQIPNFVEEGRANPRLAEGMTLAIEPMVNMGTAEVETLADDWTVVTKDGRPSAHYEHTVAITRAGPDILTLGPHEPKPCWLA